MGVTEVATGMVLVSLTRSESSRKVGPNILLGALHRNLFLEQTDMSLTRTLVSHRDEDDALVPLTNSDTPRPLIELRPTPHPGEQM
jgi:hypothetical protein